MKRVAIIDCGAGNLHSVEYGFRRAAQGEEIGLEIVTDAARLAGADYIVLPGVGAFADCMRGLEALGGMRAALEREVLENRKPFIGICVGMQMLVEYGLEHGHHAGLGWLKGHVAPIEAKELRIPHMGWNELRRIRPEHPLLAGIDEGEHMYFVHSFHVIGDEADRLATVDYGNELTVALVHGNICGTQFHPEKSDRAGERLLKNFLNWRPYGH